MLNEKHFDMLKSEFDISKEQLKQMTKDDWKALRIKCFEIEADETELDDDGAADITDLGIMATEIVDTTYNDMIKSLGE